MLADAPSRLREERTRLGLNQVEFGRRGGVSKNTQLAYETGSSPIPLDYLSRLEGHGVDVAYVALGQHAARAPTGSSETPDGMVDRRIPWRGAPEAAAVDPDLVEIDQVDLRFGMGATYLDGPVGSEKRVFSRSWLRNFTRAAPEQLFWTLGDGDSMEPTIRSGEVILIDRSQDVLRTADGIWAVTVGEIVQVKRLRPRASGAVEILSDNPAVPPDLAVDGELHIIGRVVAVVRRL
ncbi:LexA family transcriptional regulator [Novosphingobium sp.]|uniref:XRE family transcriptional regulator n=1 Tax=Novosphingobium sp. TaxID=1874826 RepID=UPI002619A913|nr:LexA family transcriptional regulator [Novosphingobium sp.]